MLNNVCEKIGKIKNTGQTVSPDRFVWEAFRGGSIFAEKLYHFFGGARARMRAADRRRNIRRADAGYSDEYRQYRQRRALFVFYPIVSASVRLPVRQRFPRKAGLAARRKAPSAGNRHLRAQRGEGFGTAHREHSPQRLSGGAGGYLRRGG